MIIIFFKKIHYEINFKNVVFNKIFFLAEFFFNEYINFYMIDNFFLILKKIVKKKKVFSYKNFYVLQF